MRIQPQAAFLRAIRAVLPRDGILVPELSQVGFATYTGAFPVLAPRTYISEGFQGTLGFGFPTALGAKVANPDKAVVSVTGDGGFMFGVQELATAAQYGIALVTIVFNNHSFANVLRDQQTQFGGRIDRLALAEPGLRSPGRELRRRGAACQGSRTSCSARSSKSSQRRARRSSRSRSKPGVERRLGR